MNPEVDFTIHTKVTTDDPEQVPVIDGNKSRDNPEPRHKIQMIQRTDVLPRDPDDQLMPVVRDSVWIEPQMIRMFQPVVLTSQLHHHLSYPDNPLPRHVICLIQERKRVSVGDFFSLPKVSKLLSGLWLQSVPSPSQPPVHLQCVLEEKRVSVGDSSSLPKVSKLLLDLWLQPVQCPYHQQSRSCSSSQMSYRCQRCIKINSWKKEDFRRVPRWKIGHGGECKAENGLRHSSLSVSE